MMTIVLIVLAFVAGWKVHERVAINWKARYQVATKSSPWELRSRPATETNIYDQKFSGTLFYAFNVNTEEEIMISAPGFSTWLMPGFATPRQMRRYRARADKFVSSLT